MQSRIQFNNTVLRDGHQSLAATRMTTTQMLPAAPLLDKIGFGGLETWGGATIDSCLRYLHENPFDRLRRLKQAAPKTPHLMLLRGQNIVQYTSFPDDVVRAFVSASARAGCDVFRIFDALNDTRNLATAIHAVVAAGRHARGEICYTISPVHTLDMFVSMAEELRRLGCHSIGIKDMSGVLTPHVTSELVKKVKRATNLPISVHSHDTAGLAAPSYLSAIAAGADYIDTSIAPFANGTAQPDTLRMLKLLEGNARCPDYDVSILAQLRNHFTTVYRELAKFTSPENEKVDSDTLLYQVPGGMLSNFRTQLSEQKMLHKFDQVMREIPVVREALGWVPLVTPTSQIVGTQAMLNVKFGRWKNLSQPSIDLALGRYGKTPGPIATDLIKQIFATTGAKPIEHRMADDLSPRMPTLRNELSNRGLPSDDESCVLYAMFPREFTALHVQTENKVEDSVNPAQLPASPEKISKPGTVTGNSLQRMNLTIDGRKLSATVEAID